MKILVADDDKTLIHMLAGLFRKRGWQVVPAYDAMQAFMFAQRDPHVDVIVLDIGMPGGSGLSVLQKLKASSRTSMIPVVVLSGSEDPEIAGKVESMGAAAFVAKPVDPDALGSLLEATVGSQHGL